MRNLSNYILRATLWGANSLFSQDPTKTFGQVSMEEMRLLTCPYDSVATAHDPI
jgi:hypothetical protein